MAFVAFVTCSRVPHTCMLGFTCLAGYLGDKISAGVTIGPDSDGLLLKHCVCSPQPGPGCQPGLRGGYKGQEWRPALLRTCCSRVVSCHRPGMRKTAPSKHFPGEGSADRSWGLACSIHPKKLKLQGLGIPQSPLFLLPCVLGPLHVLPLAVCPQADQAGGFGLGR